MAVALEKADRLEADQTYSANPTNIRNSPDGVIIDQFRYSAIYGCKLVHCIAMFKASMNQKVRLRTKANFN